MFPLDSFAIRLKSYVVPVFEVYEDCLGCLICNRKNHVSKVLLIFMLFVNFYIFFNFQISIAVRRFTVFYPILQYKTCKTKIYVPEKLIQVLTDFVEPYIS